MANTVLTPAPTDANGLAINGLRRDDGSAHVEEQYTTGETKVRHALLESLIGATSEAEATGNGGLNGLLKRLRTLLGGGLPAALGGAGGLKVEQQGAMTLPAGASTETTLAALNTKIPASPAAEHTTAASPHATRLSDGVAFYKGTTPADTQPVSAAALPLPTGAATQATLASVLAALPAALVGGRLDVNIGALAAALLHPHLATQTLVIAAGAAVSGRIDALGYLYFGVVIPAAFTNTSIGFQVSEDDVTYQPLYDIAGQAVSVTVAQGRSYDLPGELSAWRYWKVTTPTNEAAARSLKITARG